MIHKAIASRDMVQSIINTITEMPAEQATRRNILVKLGNHLDRLNTEVSKLKREFEEQDIQSGIAFPVDEQDFSYRFGDND